MKTLTSLMYFLFLFCLFEGIFNENLKIAIKFFPIAFLEDCFMRNFTVIVYAASFVSRLQNTSYKSVFSTEINNPKLAIKKEHE